MSTAPIAPETDQLLARLLVVAGTSPEGEVRNRLSALAADLCELHALATLGPADVAVYLNATIVAAERLRDEVLRACPEVLRRPADTVEVEVTGYVTTLPSGTYVMTGTVRDGEEPNDVRFTADAAEASSLLGALAAGETVAIEVYTDQLVGR